MIEVHYGVIRVDGHWAIIANGLRLGGYTSEADAESVVRRMADQAAGLPVHLHLQDACGELRRESHLSE